MNDTVLISSNIANSRFYHRFWLKNYNTRTKYRKRTSCWVNEHEEFKIRNESFCCVRVDVLRCVLVVFRVPKKQNKRYWYIDICIVSIFRDVDVDFDNQNGAIPAIRCGRVGQWNFTVCLGFSFFLGNDEKIYEYI